MSSRKVESALKIYFESERGMKEYLVVTAESVDRNPVDAYNQIADNETVGTIKLGLPRPAEVRTYLWILLPPLILSFYSTLEYLKMFFISHLFLSRH